QPVELLAWSVGAVTLVGAPLFGGFVPRQMTTGAALQAGGLLIPLTGLAWAGDALLALALLRLPTPAFAGMFANPAAQSTDVPATAPADAGMDDVADRTNAEDPEQVEEDEVEEADEIATPAPRAGRVPAMRDPRELPALALALLALVVGIAPQL